MGLAGDDGLIVDEKLLGDSWGTFAGYKEGPPLLYELAIVKGLIT